MFVQNFNLNGQVYNLIVDSLLSSTIYLHQMNSSHRIECVSSLQLNTPLLSLKYPNKNKTHIEQMESVASI